MTDREQPTAPLNKLTLGSLFDGSGGFPLGGLLSGIVYYSQNDEKTKGGKQNEDSFRRWSF